MSMSNNDPHSANYFDYLKIGIVLLILTALNIFIAGFAHSEIISGLIIAISVIQATITLIWLMHLDLDSKLMRVFVAGVFILFAVVVIITFFDYSFR
jgi:cytochrome c oxidase subunit IV